MKTPEPASYRNGWAAKTLAGLLPGFVIAICMAGLFLHLMPGDTTHLGRYFVSRWLTIPIWMAILSLVYLFRNGRRAWNVLGLTALLSLAALMLCRHFLH